MVLAALLDIVGWVPIASLLRYTSILADASFRGPALPSLLVSKGDVGAWLGF